MSKRTASSASLDAPPSKRSSASTSTAALTAYFPSKTGPARPPQPIVASDPITDRQSTFVAHAAPCSNHTQAHTLQNHIRSLRTGTHPVECSHEILGWRCLTLRPGRTGLDSEDDFKVVIDGDDDGEKGGAAVIREVLTQEGGVDVAIVISRLYGGIMLGPARFTHMRKCASQALSRLLEAQRLPQLLSRLEELDDEIRSHAPANASPAAAATAKYAALDVAKAERLVAAREKRLELLRRKQREEEEELWRQIEAQEGGKEQPPSPQTTGPARKEAEDKAEQNPA
ncbi:hypothetical protein JCM10908_007042 [Rhodotorula pacifica]|uniref:YigZ family protein n=1 Tax=Rhodotorula pacifica TaxID=1495444 RepID=UPI00317C0B72